MARVLGYGGIGNTRLARSFSGKAAAPVDQGEDSDFGFLILRLGAARPLARGVKIRKGPEFVRRNTIVRVYK